MKKESFPQHQKQAFCTLTKDIIGCKRCQRLVTWRRLISKKKTARFMTGKYWGKGVPGFGDKDARLLVVGLAPAAHGGNRTGRIFTGDRSGEWLYGALHKFGFADRPQSVSRYDGLRLSDCYITAVARCAPPANKLLRREIDNCRRYLTEELRLLKNLCVIIALGKVAFDEIVKCLKVASVNTGGVKPVFKHGNSCRMNNGLLLLVSFHPSQQNTFTGKLTRRMFHQVFRQAMTALGRRYKVSKKPMLIYKNQD